MSSFIFPLCLYQLKLWIDEKMLTAQDVSYDEARNLHTKWQKHQAFMAELAANKDWLDKVDKVTSVARATRCLCLWGCFWADPGQSID